MKPYYEDEWVSLYHGDFREILPALGVQADLIVADPPYNETSLAWDRWPAGWPAQLTPYGSSMWCFGSLRMFLGRSADFADWKYAQEIVWEKHNGSTFHRDRFRRIHEFATHWYRGEWRDIHHVTPTTPTAGRHGAANGAQPTRATSTPRRTSATTAGPS